MTNILKGWLVDNTVTADPNDKILVLESTGKADSERVYEEMLAEDTGLRRETIVHVSTLYERVCARLLMNGYQLSTGLFYAVPRFTGVIKGGKWDPEQNNIYVVFNQDKVMREEIAKTSVHILGEKPDVMYILEVEDRKTGLRDRSATPGRNLFVRGAYLKVAGTDKSVGVFLRNHADSKETRLDDDMIVRNNPSELILLMPADLADGEYDLVIRTQYSSKHVLKVPREVSTVITVGEGGGGGGDSESPDEI